MQSMIIYVNIILSILLIALVLVQKSNTDAGGAFSSDSMGTYKRRGLEKTLYQATIIVSVLFAISLALHAL